MSFVKKTQQGDITSVSPTGEEWKDVRSAFTPIFTSGKLKGMTPAINKGGDPCTNDISREGGGGVRD